MVAPTDGRIRNTLCSFVASNSDPYNRERMSDVNVIQVGRDMKGLAGRRYDEGAPGRLGTRGRRRT